MILSYYLSYSRLNYVNSIQLKNQFVYKVSISETTNDIAFIGNTPNKLYFYTGNCDLIGEKDLASDLEATDKQTSTNSNNNNIFMKSLCFSNATEGLNVNVIAVGLSNGKINLYSTWDLTLLREITFNYDANTTIGCIISLAYSRDCKRLYVSDTYARVYILEAYNSANAVSKMQNQMLLSSSNYSLNVNNYLPNYIPYFSCFT
jgi:hypothetical protein